MVSIKRICVDVLKCKIFASLFRITETIVIVFFSTSTGLRKLIILATASIPSGTMHQLRHFIIDSMINLQYPTVVVVYGLLNQIQIFHM
jgi:hypothetical protein